MQNDHQPQAKKQATPRTHLRVVKENETQPEDAATDALSDAEFDELLGAVADEEVIAEGDASDTAQIYSSAATQPGTQTQRARQQPGRSALNSQMQNRGADAKGDAPPVEVDYAALLEEMGAGRKRRFIAPPPEETFSNLGAWLGWGGRALARPFNWFLEDAADIPEDQYEYMSPLKVWMYRLGAALIFGWGIIITQSVTARLFPEVDRATSKVIAEGFFAGGFNITLKTFIAAAIFAGMLAAVETMLFDKNKSRAKLTIIILAFSVDFVINAIGWSDFMQHGAHFEWLPFVPAFSGKQLEWGSFILELAALLNACLPELMWEKARRARKRAKTLARAAGNSPQGQVRGVWVRTPDGKARFITEEQARRLAAAGQRRAKGGRQ